uniref:PPFIA binding protein 1a n=1 Tax=Oryzias latipes TaxID=8090 RepID=A0A3P9J2P6_ORYLA
MMSDASEMLAAALEQMDGIIAGSKAIDYSNGLFDCQSPTSPFLGGLRVLHLLEDLRAALELMDNEEKDNLRCQISDSTAEGLAEWLQGRTVKESSVPGIMAVKSNVHSSDAVYQERLSRLESDKECLILQVSVLTDQVEVQGEKIRDLDNSLDQHREKLDAAEQLLQQELLNRTTLETQKLELMTEVSSLKLKLTSLERDHRGSEVNPPPRRSRRSGCTCVVCDCVPTGLSQSAAGLGSVTRRRLSSSQGYRPFVCPSSCFLPEDPHPPKPPVSTGVWSFHTIFSTSSDLVEFPDSKSTKGDRLTVGFVFDGLRQNPEVHLRLW